MRIALLAIVALLTALSALPARANPIIGRSPMFHVHSWDPDFCQTAAIEECEQIDQYSGATGDVEFDLYLIDWVHEPPVAAIGGEVRWPEQWTYQSFALCDSGIAQVEVEGHQASLSISFDPGLFEERTCILLGRFRLTVSGFGALELDPFSINGQGWPARARGEAGVVCAHSQVACLPNFEECCCDYFDPSELELHASVGDSASATLTIGGYPGEYCFTRISSDAPWLHVSYNVGYLPFTATVWADAGDLPEGTYEAWVHADCECRRCARVVFTVQGESPVSQTSWGQLKDSYR